MAPLDRFSFFETTELDGFSYTVFYLLLISSGLVGGLIGGSISNNMEIPQNLWWMREIIKIGITIVAMYTIQIIRLQIYNFKNNI